MFKNMECKKCGTPVRKLEDIARPFFCRKCNTVLLTGEVTKIKREIREPREQYPDIEIRPCMPPSEINTIGKRIRREEEIRANNTNDPLTEQLRRTQEYFIDFYGSTLGTNED